MYVSLASPQLLNQYKTSVNYLFKEFLAIRFVIHDSAKKITWSDYKQIVDDRILIDPD